MSIPIWCHFAQACYFFDGMGLPLRPGPVAVVLAEIRDNAVDFRSCRARYSASAGIDWIAHIEITNCAIRRHLLAPKTHAFQRMLSLQSCEQPQRAQCLKN